MKDPASCVLEYALGEHFGARERQDVTWRVLEHLDRADDGASTGRPASFRWGGLAAAAVIALGLAIWLQPPRESRASSSIALSVFGSNGVETATSDIPADRIALVTEDARIGLPSGARFDATAGTVFRWSIGDPALEVFAGTVDVSAPDARFAVGSPTGTLELTASSRARFVVEHAQHPVLPNRIARNLAMNSRHASLFAPTLTATLLAGAGTLFCGGPPHVLVAERPTVVDPVYGNPPATPPSADDNPFELEPGAWNLFDPDATEAMGLETVRVGPHPQSLLIDVSTSSGGTSSAAHIVLKYEPDLGRITGSLVDSFGGPIGVLVGELDEEGGRVLDLYRTDGTPFGMRMRMSWIDDDERRTRFERKEGEDWVTVRERVHRRR